MIYLAKYYGGYWRSYQREPYPVLYRMVSLAITTENSKNSKIRQKTAAGEAAENYEPSKTFLNLTPKSKIGTKNNG